MGITILKDKKSIETPLQVAAPITPGVVGPINPVMAVKKLSRPELVLMVVLISRETRPHAPGMMVIIIIRDKRKRGSRQLIATRLLSGEVGRLSIVMRA
jgi:hypothetical protein